MTQFKNIMCCEGFERYKQSCHWYGIFGRQIPKSQEFGISLLPKNPGFIFERNPIKKRLFLENLMNIWFIFSTFPGDFWDWDLPTKKPSLCMRILVWELFTNFSCSKLMTNLNRPRENHQPLWVLNIYSQLTGRFPTVSYALIPAFAKLEHFGLWEEIAQDWDIVECCG